MTRKLNVTLKTIEQNVLVGLRSGKSSAAITDNKRLHSRYSTVETTEKHKASRDLSATA